MAKEPEKPKDAAEQTEEKPKQPSKLFKGPMLLVIIGVGGFVVALVVFSFVLGVFSSSKGTKDAGKQGDSTAVAKASITGADSLAGQPAVEPGKTAGGTGNRELDSMETAIFGDNGIRNATNMDDIVALAARNDSGKAHLKDSASPNGSLSSEWAKLEAEKKQLEAKKKEMDDQELRLKQLLAKTDQLESARIGSLAKLYDGMNPQQVAPLITKLTDDQAVDVLLRMKPGNAAKVLESLNADRAARISVKMITLKEEN
jgi:flagellar motility protein MotE (MotC chaperone)